MSIESWKAEFYAVIAHELKGASDVESVAHALVKWTGMLAPSLERHQLVRYFNGVEDPTSKEKFHFGAETCSLCVNHYCSVNGLYDQSGNDLRNCMTCPLAVHLGKSCDEESASFYKQSMERPELMVTALSKVLLTLSSSERRKNENQAKIG